ncbi:hypothetical protein N7486_008506 [Penicillium sp. IBT 16267x]|nr:hypothetical protein N7486_008506 [Penicillium sp. IBT 16267x]
MKDALLRTAKRDKKHRNQIVEATDAHQNSEEVRRRGQLKLLHVPSKLGFEGGASLFVLM